MAEVQRVLDPDPVASFGAYLDAGGGRGREAARKLGPAGVLDDLDASGLRGRGGAGFPTGTKWRTVAAFGAGAMPPAVLVNAAEGEPGSFKDRALIAANPYRVLEGALIAAATIGASRLVIGVKRSATATIERLRTALAELRAAGWLEGLDVGIVAGPGEYLFGEETALMEVAEGRPPFPRLAPPFRHGVTEVAPPDAGGQSAAVVLADEGPGTDAPPTLANNAETLAHVALIAAEGPQWFRSVGTVESPGTLLCTVSGDTIRHGVGEFAMGTPLSEVLSVLGGGPLDRQGIVAVGTGVSGRMLRADELDVPVAFEAFAARGATLGSASFIVVGDAADPLQVVAGMSRFLAVESCGQCLPCKDDGLRIAEALDRLCRGEGNELDVLDVHHRIGTITDGARCSLAQQHHDVVGGFLQGFEPHVGARTEAAAEPVEPALVAPIAVGRGGRFEHAPTPGEKQPDWSYGERDSGRAPAAHLREG